MTNGHSLPKSINTLCPFCNILNAFALRGHHPGALVWTAISQCASCEEQATFIVVGPTKTNDVKQAGVREICIYPEPEDWHASISFAGEIPDWLSRSFNSTVEAYNARQYVATAVCARRTLEGLFKSLVPEDKKTLVLAKLIEEASKSTNLVEPLHKLSHAVRAGGNLGAHFDEAKEPDQEMAKHMVELVEYLISYLFVLPKKIDGLNSTLDR